MKHERPRTSLSTFAPILCFALIVAFYFWTADATLPATSAIPDSYYGMLTDAFFHGHVELLVPPEQKLLDLRDPYDPIQNDHYRLHDALLYHGKYYLYWGVAPVLLLYAPVRALTGGFLHDNIACAAFASTGLLFFTLLIRRIRLDHFPASSSWLLPLLMLLCAFGNQAPFILRRPIVYEVAITSTYCLTGAFLYGAYRSTFRHALDSKWLWFAGLSLGLVFLDRPTQALFGLALAAGCYRWRRVPQAKSRFAAAVGPLVICIGAQALYNAARFASPFEYGVKYQLAGFSLRGYHMVSVTRGLYSGLIYLFNLPTFSLDFPFITAQSNGLVGPLGYVGSRLLTIMPFSFPEPAVGALVAVPSILILLAAPAFVRSPTDPALRWFFSSITLSSLLTGVMLAGVGSTLRYELDFLPGLLLATSILILWFDNLAGVRRRRLGFQLVLATATFYSICFSAALSLTGYNDGYRTKYPSQYRTVAKFVGQAEHTLFGLPLDAYPGAVRVRLGKPTCAPDGLGWPLLTTGRTEAGDFIFLRCAGPPDVFVVAWGHWGIPSVLSTPFVLPDNSSIDVDIEAPILFDNPDRPDHTACIVRIDGREVFHQDPCQMYPSQPSQIFLLKNPILGGLTVDSYFDWRAHRGHYPGIVSGRLAKPACAGNFGRPLVTSGVPGAADVIALRCAGAPNRFVVAWDHGVGFPARLGQQFSVRDGAPIYIKVVAPVLISGVMTVMPRERDQTKCVVRIDGHIVFDQKPCNMYPALPSQVFLFKNPIGGGNTLPSYY